MRILCPLRSFAGLRAFSARIAPSQTAAASSRSEEHTSELQSLRHLVCRLLFDKHPAPPEFSSLPLPDALPIFLCPLRGFAGLRAFSARIAPSQTAAASS